MELIGILPGTGHEGMAHGNRAYADAAHRVHVSVEDGIRTTPSPEPGRASPR